MLAMVSDMLEGNPSRREAIDEWARQCAMQKAGITDKAECYGLSPLRHGGGYTVSLSVQDMKASGFIGNFVLKGSYKGLYWSYGLHIIDGTHCVFKIVVHSNDNTPVRWSRVFDRKSKEQHKSATITLAPFVFKPIGHQFPIHSGHARGYVYSDYMPEQEIHYDLFNLEDNDEPQATEEQPSIAAVSIPIVSSNQKKNKKGKKNKQAIEQVEERMIEDDGDKERIEAIVDKLCEDFESLKDLLVCSIAASNVRVRSGNLGKTKLNLAEFYGCLSNRPLAIVDVMKMKSRLD